MKFGDILKALDEKFPLPQPIRHAGFGTWTLIQDLVRCDLIKQAYAMAYVTLLSLIPSLAAISCVLALFAPMLDPESDLVAELRQFLLNNLASGSGLSVVSYLEDMLSSINLKSIGWTSFGALLVTLILLLSQIEGALNRVWLVRKARNMFTRFMYFWTFMTLGVVAIGIIVGASGFRIQSILNATTEAQSSGAFMSMMMTFVSGFAFFFLLYKFVPNTKVKTKNAAIGGVVASILLQIAARAFGIYVANFNSYQTLYGALAALPLFLMLLYICWLIILLGAVVSWRIQLGFPDFDEEDTLDAAKLPKEKLRNVQVRAAMPAIVLIAIHQKFSAADGQGLAAEDLAEHLKLPVSWLGDSLDALESMGYIVCAQRPANLTKSIDGSTEAYFPAFPASSIQLERLFQDLDSPMVEWLKNWKHDFEFDLNSVVQQWSGPGRQKILQENLQTTIDRLKKRTATP